MKKSKVQTGKGDRRSKSRDGGEDKKNTSLRLDPKTLKALKMRAIQDDTSIQKIIERLIEDYLEDTKRKK
jgi:hypothetical protein